MNEHYLMRYHKFISNCKLLKRKSDIYEKHHILPKALGGNDSKENFILLTPREHYIAHWILAHAYGNKMWYAFWMMNADTRNKHYRYKNSRGYEKAKLKQKEQMNIKMKGMIGVYDKELLKSVFITTEMYNNNKDRYIHHAAGKATYLYNGKSVQLNTNDPLVINGEAISIRTHYKHTETTKQKMSDNGIKNKIVIHNIYTGELKFINKDEALPENYNYGYNKERSEAISERNKKIFNVKKWITNGVDNKRINVYSESDIPEGWTIGRTLQTKVCEYCGKKLDVANYAQYHGNKCKKYKGDTTNNE